MKCPKCGFISFDYLDQCKRCGKDWGPKKALLGVERNVQPTGRGQSSSTILEEGMSTAALEVLLDEEFDRLYERLKMEEEETSGIQWGGFLLRSCAFSVDLFVLSLFSLLLFYLSFVGYTVGLSAHHQSLSPDNVGGFLWLLSFAWFGLGTVYFVLFHGLGGKTIGKWIFGLRVVGADQGPISYNQALIRWIGSLISSFLGLGVLWIIWNREKRGWHDLMARTWVIRDRTIK